MELLRPTIAIFTTLSLAACAGSDGAGPDGTTNSNPSTDGPGPTTAPTDATPTSTAPTTTIVETTTSATDTTAPAPAPAPTPTTTAPDDEQRFELSAPVPTGELVVGPDDVVALRTDGDLIHLPGALDADDANEPILLVDNPDPREPVIEGPGPNYISDVAGVVDGSLIYADCCEPVSGNVFALTAPLDSQSFSLGGAPNVNPSGTRLATANFMALTVVDTTTGDGSGVMLNQDPDAEFRSIIDVDWADDDTIIGVVAAGDDPTSFTTELELYDATTLQPTLSVEISGLSDLDSTQFAGLTPDGMIAIHITGPDLSVVRMFDPVTLEEDPDAALEFPATVAAVEAGTDGSYLWIDGTTLFHLPSGAAEALPIGDEIRHGWFATSANGV